MTKVTTLQKDHTRYTFIRDTYPNSNNARYCVKHEQLFITGSSVGWDYTTKERGNALYKELIEKGFKQFRNGYEVSWYATIENNTPYDEEWITEGKFLIPIKSRVLTETA